MLSRSDDIPCRRVDDNDAVLGGGVYVDVVDTDAGARDDAEFVGGGEEGGRDPGFGADDYC
jgi:hypothetical protein